MHREDTSAELGCAHIRPAQPWPDGDEVAEVRRPEAGARGTWRIVYTAGPRGMEVGGRVRITIPHGFTAPQVSAFFDPGFTTVETPGGALKVIPLRDAKETSVETIQSTRPPPNRDLFVTRLIPLRYIDAESIVNTLKPLVSKEAAMAAYEPTNTVILTESASNIRRLIAILESIDIEIYKEELAVIRVEFADAPTMAEQISEIFGAEVSGAAPPRRTDGISSPLYLAISQYASVYFFAISARNSSSVTTHSNFTGLLSHIRWPFILPRERMRGTPPTTTIASPTRVNL